MFHTSKLNRNSLQSERKTIPDKYEEPATLPGITAAEKNLKTQRKKINTLLFDLMYYYWHALLDMHGTLIGTNLSEYISRNLILHLTQMPRKEPKFSLLK